MNLSALPPELLSVASVTLPTENIVIKAEPGPDSTITGATWLCYRVDKVRHPLPIRVPDLSREDWEVCHHPVTI